MTREKSRGLQTPVSRLFHSFGQRAAACSAFRCSRATIVDSLLASISMLTWCYSSGPNGVKAFLWTAGAGVQNLGTLSGGSDCKARDINDSNEVVGTAKTASGDRAVLWTKVGNVRNLGTLPGDTSSEATAINNAGDVVGYSNGPRGVRAFLWSSATEMQNLGVLPGGTLAELWTSTTRGRWLGLLRVLRGNGHLCGHEERAYKT